MEAAAKTRLTTIPVLAQPGTAATIARLVCASIIHTCPSLGYLINNAFANMGGSYVLSRGS